MRIALDTMGGDHAPTAPIDGALGALARNSGLRVILVGPAELLKAELDRRGVHEQVMERIAIEPASQVIVPSEPPVAAFRSKKDSSMRVAMRLVDEGEAVGVVSSGSTGALMAGGLLTLGRIRGVSRPAIATVLPTFTGGRFLMLDLGAHMETDDRNLVQHAIMGAVYAQRILGIEHPRIGLLNVGEEATKGREIYKRAHERLSGMPVRFVGNIEGRVLFDQLADVVVCDGFVGNVILKVIEAVGMSMFGLLRRELKRDARSQLGGLLAKPAFHRVYRTVDYQEYGGAQLLGLRRPVVKCHGSADARAIQQGIETAVEIDRHGVARLIENEIAKHEEG